MEEDGVQEAGVVWIVVLGQKAFDRDHALHGLDENPHEAEKAGMELCRVCRRDAKQT